MSPTSVPRRVYIEPCKYLHITRLVLPGRKTCTVSHLTVREISPFTSTYCVSLMFTPPIYSHLLPTTVLNFVYYFNVVSHYFIVNVLSTCIENRKTTYGYTWCILWKIEIIATPSPLKI